ncbi:MAG: peptide deformylase [Actinomycetota bacterium]|nr:peptide deformylase [Actinomycetota bacterium]
MSKQSRICSHEGRDTIVIMPIRILGDPVLRAPTKPVEVFDRRLRGLRDDMIETMYDAPGVGLAGPQVGISQRLFVFDDGETGPVFMANPQLVDGQGSQLEEEGCLSIPGPYHVTERFSRITCRGQDVEGSPFEMTGEALLARIFQHETDHLDGMLYIDRLDDDGRRAVLAELRRIELSLEEGPPPKRRLMRRAES